MEALAGLTAGSIAVLRPGGTIGGILISGSEESDVPVPFVALSNGAETSILILSQNGTPLGAGRYTLRAVMDRDRWKSTTAPHPDPVQHYHRERSITLQW
jgi:hypothetical protein